MDKENASPFKHINFSYPTRKPKLIDGDDYSNENGNSDNFIDEYQEQNARLERALQHRLQFLEELKEKEIQMQNKRLEISQELESGNQEVQYVDQEIQNLVAKCQILANETTNRQDKLLQDKMSLRKKEAETLFMLQQSKLSHSKTVEKSQSLMQTYNDSFNQIQFYRETLQSLNTRHAVLQQEMKEIQDTSQLDQQLSQLISQKQNLNELLQTMKGNIRVYCRIRPLKQEEKQRILENEFKRVFEENQQQQQMQNNGLGSKNPSVVSKFSVSKQSSQSNLSVSKSSVSKQLLNNEASNAIRSTMLPGYPQQANQIEQSAQFQQEMKQFVQRMMSKSSSMPEENNDNDYIESDEQQQQKNLECSSTVPFKKMIRTSNSTNLKLVVPLDTMRSDNNIKEYPFSFEHIFEEDATQMEVFSNLQELIQSVLDGYNVCIFAYGPTGSGKTFTMQGEEDYDKWGIIPRSIEYIFQEIAKMTHYNWSHKIKIRFSEIYNDNLIDLLHSDVKKDEVIDEEISNGPEEIMKLLLRGYEKRKVAGTDCNDQSSRSHSIFQMMVNGYNLKKQGKDGAPIGEPLLKGSLNLIDLAGSERLSLSKVVGERLKETQSINKSLTSLMDVITNLSKKEAFIPYRNSKLTYYLQDYLGGKSKTLMMVNISPCPSTFHSTLTTLRFADKVKICKNKVDSLENNTSRSISPFGFKTSQQQGQSSSLGKSSFNKQQLVGNGGTPKKTGPFKNVLSVSNLRNTLLQNSAKKQQ